MLILNGRADSRIFRPGQVQHEHGYHDPKGRFAEANAALAKKVHDFLNDKFDHQPWMISAEIEHGIVRVALSGFLQWPYIVHVDTLKSDPGMKCVLKAAGELLERFRMPRHQFNMADWQSALQRMPHHFHRNRKAPV